MTPPSLTASTSPYSVTHTNRQRNRIEFLAISRMFTQRLEATKPGPTPTHAQAKIPSLSLAIASNTTCHHRRVNRPDSIMLEEVQPWSTYHWDTQLQVKIKSHQVRSNGHLKYNDRPQLYLILVHSNHWADKTCEIPYTDRTAHPFPLRCHAARITVYLSNEHVLRFIPSR